LPSRKLSPDPVASRALTLFLKVRRNGSNAVPYGRRPETIFSMPNCFGPADRGYKCSFRRGKFSCSTRGLGREPAPFGGCKPPIFNRFAWTRDTAKSMTRGDREARQRYIRAAGRQELTGVAKSLAPPVRPSAQISDIAKSCGCILPSD